MMIDVHNHQEHLFKRLQRKTKLTLRSAPALELNLVAVTTLRFLGSTAPSATSGVSTIATSFGGAVRIVARPNLIAKPLDPLTPPDPDPDPAVLCDGLSGLNGNLLPVTLNLPGLVVVL
jgi:hypothetical protein